eukprot:6109828-Prymnesium_polylepis.1
MTAVLRSPGVDRAAFVQRLPKTLRCMTGALTLRVVCAARACGSCVALRCLSRVSCGITVSSVWIAVGCLSSWLKPAGCPTHDRDDSLLSARLDLCNTVGEERNVHDCIHPYALRREREVATVTSCSSCASRMRERLRPFPVPPFGAALDRGPGCSGGPPGAAISVGSVHARGGSSRHPLRDSGCTSGSMLLT